MRNKAWEHDRDSSNEPEFEQLHGLMRSCVRSMETNTHRCNKMQHTRQEQLSNPVNEKKKATSCHNSQQKWTIELSYNYVDLT